MFDNDMIARVIAGQISLTDEQRKILIEDGQIKQFCTNAENMTDPELAGTAYDAWGRK